tara:strand:+ start:24 stop:287 length:264 start_codon:yes stop_codon:yes gene_type:complete
MKFYVYLITSTNKSKIISYVGYTNNLKKRLLAHNTSKGAKFTRGRKWKMIYNKSFATRSAAMKAEIKLKKNLLLRKKIKEKSVYAKK